MPSFESTLTTPEKEDVTVRSISSYATLWSQFLNANTQKNTLFYYIFAPLFFTQLCLKLLTAKKGILLINPEVYPIEIPSTSKITAENPIAYTTETEHTSQYNHILLRPVRLITLGFHAIIAFIKQDRIAYLETSDESVINPNNYLITTEDTVRPTVLFRN